MTGLKYKLVALDVDGTLVTDNLVITEPVKKAVAEAIQHGAIVTLATGRMFRSAVQFANELNLSAPLICYQGAMVKHSTTGETIFHQPVPLDLARQFIELAQEKGIHINAYVDDHIYVAEMTDEAKYYSDLARVPAEVVGDLLNLVDRPERAPTKLVLVTDEDKTLETLNEFEAAFGHSLYVTRSHPRFTEAVHPDCNKGVALRAVARWLDLPVEQTLAVGDNLNDMPMLEMAGFSVAVANSSPVVKEKAGFVTEGAVGNGVVEAINKFILS